MRVLTVGNRWGPAALGGYERVWAAAVDGLRAAGHDVAVLASTMEPRAPGAQHRLSTAWRAGAFPRRDPLAVARAAWGDERALARGRDADVVVFFGLGGLGLRLVGRVRAPGLAIVHDAWPVYGAQVDPLAARLGWHPERIAHWSCNSAWLCDGLRARGLPLARASVDPPGVDPARFGSAPPRPAWTGELALVGRVEPSKGVDVALEALAPGQRLTITGSGEPAALAGLRARAAARGLALLEPPAGAGVAAEPDPAARPTAAAGPDPAARPTAAAGPGPAARPSAAAGPNPSARPTAAAGPDPSARPSAAGAPDPASRSGGASVVLAGATDDPAAAYAAADAVWFPVTWEEPFGLVPLEAMAVGRPVIATGTGGSAEYLRDGENCLLVAPGDAAALRAATLRLAGDPALRARLVDGGRATAARFTEAAWVARVVALTQALGR